MTSTASIIALLKTALLLLSLAQGPNVPQALHDQAVTTANKAIAVATQYLAHPATQTTASTTVAVGGGRGPSNFTQLSQNATTSAAGSGGGSTPALQPPIVSGGGGSVAPTPLPPSPLPKETTPVLPAVPVVYEKHITLRGANSLESAQGLENPERGFRSELALDAEDLSHAFWDTTPDICDFLQSERQKYGEPSMNLMQLYMYLGNPSSPLSSSALTNVSTLFTRAKQCDMRLLLRFAYQKDTDRDPYATQTAGGIHAHLAQLKAVLDKGIGALYVMQAGFVGAWGEWHHDTNQIQTSPASIDAILTDMVNAAPSSRKITVRETAFRDAVINNDVKKRIGYNDDFFTLGLAQPAWDWTWPDNDFLTVRDTCGTDDLPVDAEMPYYSDPSMKGIFLDGFQTIGRMRVHCMTSFSIVHSFDPIILKWRADMISAQKMREEHMPPDPAYFSDANGAVVKRSAYDYIRDHLGYRIVAQSIDVATHEDSVHGTLKAINYGLARPVSHRYAQWVLIDQQKQVHEFPTSVDVADWYPLHDDWNNVYSLPLDVSLVGLSSGEYRLGLWLPDADLEARYVPAGAAVLGNSGNMHVETDISHQYRYTTFDDIVIVQTCTVSGCTAALKK